MTTSNKSEKSSQVTSENTSGKPTLSLDWWAVLFSLALAAIVFAGLQVTW
jgi:hypothetical protein